MESERVIIERIALLLTVGLLVVMSHRTAHQWGFWKLSNMEPKTKISAILFLLPLLIGYLLFLGLQLIIVGFTTLFKVPLIPWFGVTSTLMSSLGVWAFSLILPQDYKEIIWGKNSNRRKNFLLGALCWLMAYPMVLFVGQAVGALVWLFDPALTPDQVAVRQIREAENSPYLLTIYFLLIVFIVPVAEEILFRGFLQSWLRSFLSFFPALISASFVFAICHYSISQGMGNWELLSSLFVLSFYLGFLYEKKETIWAPIGLHSFFNAISMIFIVFFDD